MAWSKNGKVSCIDLLEEIFPAVRSAIEHKMVE